jgi:hypothetical protein
MLAGRVVDMGGVAMSNIDRRFFGAMGKGGRISEYVYPQLLGRSVNVRPPSFFMALWSVVSTFMTDKMKAKMAMCPGPSEEHPSASSCPFIKGRFDDLSALPSFLGGECVCTEVGGCIRNTPNLQYSPNLPIDEDGFSVVQVR